MSVVSTVQEVRVSLSLGLSLGLPLTVVSVCVGVSVSITVAKAVAIVSSVQEVRVGLSLGVCLGDSPGKPLSCNGAFRSSFAGSGCPGCPRGRRQGRGHSILRTGGKGRPQPWLRLWIRIPLHIRI